MPLARARHSMAKKLHIRVAEVPRWHPKVPAETAAADRSRVPVLWTGRRSPGRPGIRDARSSVEHLFSAAPLEARLRPTAKRPVEPCEVIVAERRASHIRPPEGGRRTAVSDLTPAREGRAAGGVIQIPGPDATCAGALETSA